jgi:hypothetical protein
LIPTTVQATSVVDIPHSPYVVEVLAPVARSIVKDTGLCIFKNWQRNGFKSNAE